MKAASLNHVYRLVWSKLQSAWVAVAETCRAQGKSTVSGRVAGASRPTQRQAQSATLTTDAKWRFVVASAFAALLSPLSSMALDTNQVANVVVGDMTVNNLSDTHTQYVHTANVNVVDFYKFGVMKGHQLDVIMPDAGRALYRVIGNSRSEIMGNLNSNGTLFLINQNGVLFGQGSEVNVGNIVTSTMNITNDDFLQARYQFSAGNVLGSIENRGVIKAKNEGYIVLLGNTVDNSGTLVASNGSVVLGSAKTATLDFFGNGLVKAKLSGDALEANIKNSGGIYADGGFVQMATNARASAINISGIVEANQLVERDGVIRLEGGENAKVEVSGQLIAQGEGTKGGSIEVTGEQVALMNGAVLDASGDQGGGQVLVGGDYQGKNDAVYNARTTYIASGATIKADAVTQGDGGKVIVWANDLTRDYGNISAQGGATSGNGGFVEVSGKQTLVMNGEVNVGAAKGTGGTVLFDPENINLNDTAASAPTNQAAGTPDTAFADNANNDSDINVNLVKGYGELYLQANNNINVNSALIMNKNGSIRLEAKNDINVNAALQATATSNITPGAGTITLKADADNSGVGNLAIGADISGGGGVTLTAATITHTAGNISALGANSTGDGGAVNITATGAVNLGTANISTMGRPTSFPASGYKGGDVSIKAASLNMTGNIDASGSSAGTSLLSGGNGGAVTIATSGNASIGNINTGAGAVGSGANNTVGVASGGEVQISSAAGSLNVGAISTQGGNNSRGANITISALNGNVSVGDINTSSAKSQAGNAGIDAGTVTINAGTGLTAGAINTFGGEGNQSKGGNGGNVEILVASGLATVGNINTAAGAPGAGNNIVAANSGSVNVTSTTGSLNMGTISTKGTSNANGGNVTLSALQGSVTALDMNTNGTGANSGVAGTNAGDITVNAGTGIDVGVINASGATGPVRGGNAGAVRLVTAAGDVKMKEITVKVGFGLNGGVNGTAKDIFVRAGGDVFQTGNIVSNAASLNTTLVAGGNYSNDGDYSIYTGSGGRWLVYADSPLTSNLGSAIRNNYNFKQYGTSYGDSLLGTGNGVIFKYAPDINLSLYVMNETGYVTKTYDSNTNVLDVSDLYVEANGIGHDSIKVSQPTSATYDNKNVGIDKLVTTNPLTVLSTTNVTDSGVVRQVYGYTLNNPQASGNVGEITPAAIELVTGITANDKVFDGNTVAALNTGAATFNGMFAGDQLTVASAAGNFDTPVVGTGKPVFISGITLGGADAGNYVLQNTSGETTASILPLPPTPALLNVSPRSDAGLGGLVPNNPALNTMTIVSLNPAAGDEEDLDAVACPVNEDHLGSTPILSSGVKLPDGVSSNCI